MRKFKQLYYIAGLVGLGLLLIPGLIQAQGQQIVMIDVDTNYEGFLAGSSQPLTIKLTIDNPSSVDIPVNAYVGFIVPGKQVYCFDNPNDLNSIVPCGTLSQLALVPFASNATLAANSFYYTDNFYTTPVPLASLNLQYGRYTVFAGFTQPGNSDIISSSLANFYLTDNITTGVSIGGVALGSTYPQLISLYNTPDSITSSSEPFPYLLSANYPGIGLSFFFLDNNPTNGQIDSGELVVAIAAVSPYYGQTEGGSGIGSSRSAVENEFGPSSDPSTLSYPGVGMEFHIDSNNQVSEIILVPPTTASAASIPASDSEAGVQGLSLVLSELASVGLTPQDLLDIINNR